MIDDHAGAPDDVNWASDGASMTRACVFPSPSLSEHPLTLREASVRVLEVRHPSDAEMYTAPPSPFNELQFVKEHPLPNVRDDPSCNVALNTDPLLSLNETRSTTKVLSDREPEL